MKSLSEIIESLKNFIKEKNPNFNVSEGTVLNDIVINVPAQEISNLYNETNNLLNKLLFNPSSFTTSELDAFGSSIGVYRKIGSPSSGFVTFRAHGDLSSSIIIPAGTIVGCSKNSIYSSITFILKDQVTITQSDYNAISGFYEKKGYVECTTIGSIGNIPPNTISVIISIIDSRVIGVFNEESFSGGSDIENDESYFTRLKGALLGGSIVGTLPHIEFLIRSHPSILINDYSIYLPEKVERNSFGGSIDIYVISPQETQITESLYINGNEGTFPTNRPIKKVIQVPNGVSYSIDTTSNYRKSPLEYSRFYSVTPGTYSITYTYNQNIKLLNDWMNKEENKPLILDILVREAFEVYLKIDVIVKIKPGFSFLEVREALLTNLRSFINSYKFKQSIHLSDIVNVIENTMGVDYIKTDISNNLIISMWKKDSFLNETFFTQVSSITLDDRRYFIFDENNSNLVLE